MSGLAQDIRLRFLFSEDKKLPASRCKGFNSYFQKTKSLTFTENTTFFNEVLRGKQHSFLKSIRYLQGKLKPRSSDCLSTIPAVTGSTDPGILHAGISGYFGVYLG